MFAFSIPFPFPLHEFFTADSWSLWLLLAVMTGFIYATMPTQRNIPVMYGGIATGAAFLILILFGPREYVQMIKTDPMRALSMFFGYVFIGSCVGAWKWDVFLRRRRARLHDVELGWLQDKGQPSGIEHVPDSMMQEFRNYLGQFEEWRIETRKGVKLQIIPRIWNYKQQWLAWAIWWPWSATYYVFADLFVGIFQSVWGVMSKQMDRWSRWRFGDYTRYE